MTWIKDEQKRIELEREQRYSDMTSKYVTLPENGARIKCLIKVSVQPTKNLRDSKKKPGQKYSTYEYETADGKILSCFDGLHREIVNALNSDLDLVESTKSDFVIIEIMNKATLNKPEWFVTVKGGV